MLLLSHVGGFAPPPPSAMAVARQCGSSYSTNCVVIAAVEAPPLASTVEIENDYRVLGPVLVTDPNGNRSAVNDDELGMVIATAVM